MNPLQQAIGLFQQGKFHESLNVIQPLIDADVKDATVWFISATIHSMTKNNPLAIKHYKRCLQLNPNYADAYSNLGVVYEEENLLTEALAAYKNALAKKKDYVSASFNLANVLEKLGRLKDAAQQYQHTLALDAKHLKTLNNYGSLLLKQRDTKKAKKVFRAAIELYPNDTAILVNLGKVCLEEDANEKATEYLKKAIAINPNQPETYNNLALVYKHTGKLEAAVDLLKTSLKLDPRYAEAECNLGTIYQDLNNYAEAEHHYKQAIQLDAKMMTAYGNLSDLYKRMGKIQDALAVLENALALNPENTDIHFHLAQLYLAEMDFKRGWNHYLWGARLERPDFPLPDKPLESNLEGKVITLTRDQGIGDELFLLRFVPTLLQRGAQVNYVCNPKLLPLLDRIEGLNVFTDITQVAEPGQQILISHLPYMLECNSVPLLPPPLPLTPQQAPLSELKNELVAWDGRPLIGLTWRAGNNRRGKLFKAIPIGELAYLAIAYPDACFIVLQRNPTEDELHELAQILGDQVVDMSHLNEALDKMLALLQLLDNYVAVSNTNVHMRASLGLHCDVFIPNPAEWRWGTSGKTSPWFPDCAVYRQESDGSWSRAVAEHKDAIKFRLFSGK